MKILFVASEYSPFGHVTNGAGQRTSLLFQACLELGDLDVLCFFPVSEQIKSKYNIIFDQAIPRDNNIGRIQKLVNIVSVNRIESVFSVTKARAEIARDIIEKNDYDLIVTRYLPSAVDCGLMPYADKLVVDADDDPAKQILLEHFNVRSAFAKWYYRTMSKRAEKFTKKIVLKAHTVLFSNLTSVAKYGGKYLQNIPYIEHEPLPLPTEEHKHNLLFVGEMEYAPNYNGVDRFIENIFPIVKRRYTDAQLRIVGRIHNSERYKKWSSVEGVTVCGFVKDIVEEYLNTAVVVVPIYEGAGTNIKVLEAMQYGRACVLSKESSCGFASHCNHGVEYLIADDDVAFAECVCELFESGSQYERIVKNAYSTVSKYYSRQGFVNTLRTALKQN